MPFRRRNFLINRPFQLKFSFYVGSWIILLSMVYPFILSDLFQAFIRTLVVDPNGPEFTFLEEVRGQYLGNILLMHLLLVSIAIVLSIFMSHRVAGPIEKLKRAMEEIEKGNLDQELTFRKRDYFQELAPAFNRMVSALKRQRDIGSPKDPIGNP